MRMRILEITPPRPLPPNDCEWYTTIDIDVFFEYMMYRYVRNIGLDCVADIMTASKCMEAYSKEPDI